MILRGIKDRYEAHHEMRISDAAIDDAASQLKLDAESIPSDVATAEQALVRLHMEETLRAEEEHARRTNQLGRAAEIAYRSLPDISRRVEALEAQLVAVQTPGLRLRETVTRRDVASITSSWTGVPLDDLISINDD